MRASPVLLALLLLATGLTGCLGTARPASDTSSRLESAADLVAAIRGRGYSLTGSTLVNPYFTSATGWAYRASGGALHVYEFRSEEAARSEVGSIGSAVLGAGNTSLYQRGRLVVVYRGRSLDFEATLSRLLGPPYL